MCFSLTVKIVLPATPVFHRGPSVLDTHILAPWIRQSTSASSPCQDEGKKSSMAGRSFQEVLAVWSTSGLLGLSGQLSFSWRKWRLCEDK